MPDLTYGYSGLKSLISFAVKSLRERRETIQAVSFFMPDLTYGYSGLKSLISFAVKSLRERNGAENQFRFFYAGLKRFQSFIKREFL